MTKSPLSALLVFLPLAAACSTPEETRQYEGTATLELSAGNPARRLVIGDLFVDSAMHSDRSQDLYFSGGEPNLDCYAQDFQGNLREGAFSYAQCSVTTFGTQGPTTYFLQLSGAGGFSEASNTLQLAVQGDYENMNAEMNLPDGSFVLRLDASRL